MIKSVKINVVVVKMDVAAKVKDVAVVVMTESDQIVKRKENNLQILH